MPRERGRIEAKSASPPKKKCFDCSKEKPLLQFYKSNNPKHEYGVMNLCKDCSTPDDQTDFEEVKRKLFGLDRPFIIEVWDKSVDEVKRRSMSESAVFGIYLKNIQMKNSKYEFAIWKDSDTESIPVSKDENNKDIIVDDDRNRQDVLRMLRYDPFEYENSSDKRHLYNKLIDFLDESTLEDSFKLPTVIEIVKTFNQLDKINAAIASIIQDPQKLASGSGNITSLVNAKEKMHKTVLALAKDNGISVNHNNNKSKGAGTLSGIIKQLNEKGIETSEVNIFDIETCIGMQQVADISNRSIMEQLMLNENDYTEMIKDQRDMIIKYEEKLAKLEEENRLLKVKLKFSDINEKKKLQVIDVEDTKEMH